MPKRLLSIMLFATLVCLLPLPALAASTEDDNYLRVTVFLDYVLGHGVSVEHPKTLAPEEVRDAISRSFGEATVLRSYELEGEWLNTDLSLNGFLNDWGLSKSRQFDLAPLRGLTAKGGASDLLLDIGMLQPIFLFSQTLSLEGSSAIETEETHDASWAWLTLTPDMPEQQLVVTVQGQLLPIPWLMFPWLLPLAIALLLRRIERNRPYSQLRWGVGGLIAAAGSGLPMVFQWLFSGPFIYGRGGMSSFYLLLALLGLLDSLIFYPSFRSFYRHSQAKAAGRPISARTALLHALKDLVVGLGAALAMGALALLGKWLLALHWLAFSACSVMVSGLLILLVNLLAYRFRLKGTLCTEPSIVAGVEHAATLADVRVPRAYRVAAPWGVELVWPKDRRSITLTPKIWDALAPAERSFALVSGMLVETLPFAWVVRPLSHLPYVFWAVGFLLLLAAPASAVLLFFLGLLVNQLVVKQIGSYAQKADVIALEKTGDYAGAIGYLRKVLELNPEQKERVKALSFEARLAAVQQAASRQSD